MPFVLGLVLGRWLIHPALAGPNGNGVSLIIILAAGVAVTSVPVVSKIFADFKILHTRFARSGSGRGGAGRYRAMARSCRGDMHLPEKWC